MARAVAVTVDPSDEKKLQALIGNVAKGVVDLGGFFEASQMHMLESITQNFEDGGRPRKWEPLSDGYLERRPDRDGGTPLSDTGALKGSTGAGDGNSNITKNALTIWAGELHGVFHQLVDVDPDDQWGEVNSVGMPFRPFLMFQEEDIKEIERLLGKHIDGHMK